MIHHRADFDLAKAQFVKQKYCICFPYGGFSATIRFEFGSHLGNVENMKSYLIMQLERGNQIDLFRRGLMSLEDGSDEDIEFIVQNVLSVEAASSAPQVEIIKQKARERFSDNLDLPENVGSVVVGLIKGLGDEQNRENEQEIILSDIKELIKDCTKSDYILDRCKKIVSLVLPKINDLKNIEKTQESIKGLFPFIRSIGHTIEIRAVRESKKRLHESSSSYNPEFISYAPVASVLLRTDTDDKYSFQIDEDALDYLIDDLLGLKKDFQKLKEKIELLKNG